jgi:serine protease Do/serine protease DegQ
MRSEAQIVTKLKFFTLGLLLATGLYAIGSLFAQKAEQRPSTATLRIDSSQVGTNNGVVTSYSEALDAVRPAVVSVYSTKFVRYRTPGTRFNDPLFDRLFGSPGSETVRPEQGLGSGVIISPEGYILTNNHVVEGADEIRVLLTDNREIVAEVVGSDPKTDVAVLKITADNLPSAILGDSDKLRVGDVVFALGNPLGIGQTATMGIVSPIIRELIALKSISWPGRSSKAAPKWPENLSSTGPVRTCWPTLSPVMCAAWDPVWPK